MKCNGFKFKRGARCYAKCVEAHDQKTHYGSLLNCIETCVTGPITWQDRLFGRCWGK